MGETFSNSLPFIFLVLSFGWGYGCGYVRGYDNGTFEEKNRHPPR